MYLDDMFMADPTPWWRRWWTCRSTTWLVERGAVRCVRRRGHKGKHRHGPIGWGGTMPFRLLQTDWVSPIHDEHFNAWAQTCPLGEWVRYVGPRFSCEVYMTERPKPKAEWEPTLLRGPMVVPDPRGGPGCTIDM
jgi:hypothetical protein